MSPRILLCRHAPHHRTPVNSSAVLGQYDIYIGRNSKRLKSHPGEAGKVAKVWVQFVEREKFPNQKEYAGMPGNVSGSPRLKSLLEFGGMDIRRELSQITRLLQYA